MRPGWWLGMCSGSTSEQPDLLPTTTYYLLLPITTTYYLLLLLTTTYYYLLLTPTLLLGQRAKSLPVGQHDGRVQSGDQEPRSGPIARLGLL